MNTHDSHRHCESDMADAARVFIARGWLVGAAFNAAYTARHPELLAGLYRLSPLPVYSWFFDSVIGVHPTFWTWMAVASEAAIGTLISGAVSEHGWGSWGARSGARSSSRCPGHTR